MKVSELIKMLQSLNQESEVYVSIRKNWRPVGEMQKFDEFKEVYDQDTNKLHYFIDVDIDEV